MEAAKKKKTFTFPSAFTILFAILILAVGLTWGDSIRFLLKTHLQYDG